MCSHNMFFNLIQKKKLKNNKNRFMLFGAHEFIFGHIGLMIQMGIYLMEDPVLAPYQFYNKWGFRYHFAPIKNTNTQLYLGTQIKNPYLHRRLYFIGFLVLFFNPI